MRQLADMIWTPLGLEAKRRLVVVPDGEVGMVPFDLFPQAGDITYLSATADLLTLPLRNRPAESLSAPLIVGDPNYHFGSTPLNPPASGGREEALPVGAGKKSVSIGGRGSVGNTDNEIENRKSKIENAFRDATAGLRRLPGSNREARRIGKIVGQDPHLWDDALVSLLEGRTAPKLLFLSTHGFAVEDRVLMGPVDSRSELGQAIKSHDSYMLDTLQHCGVALAGASTYLANREPHPIAGDGFFTGYKFTMLDLRGTDVILSACNTNAAVKRNGRGMLGLRTALFHAGAKSLILTLWPISDVATGPFMEELCKRRYQQNQSPLEALNASKEYLKNLTIGEMKQGYWLSEDAEKELRTLREASEGYPEDQTEIDKTLEEMKRLRDRPDTDRPFENPIFWAGFVLYGG